ncbi:hypothetical protein KK420_00905 [Clostridioides difficile]|nr:hypothetical protein [Clostridioides difficile]
MNKNKTLKKNKLTREQELEYENKFLKDELEFLKRCVPQEATLKTVVSLLIKRKLDVLSKIRT